MAYDLNANATWTYEDGTLTHVASQQSVTIDIAANQGMAEHFGARLVSIFVFPPSWAVLEERLRGRATEDEAAFRTRLENARWEISFAPRYEYYVVNDELPEALGRLRAILVAESCRRIRWAVPPLESGK